MKKIIMLMALALLASGAALNAPCPALAASDREEVEVRLELNNVTSEELAATGAVTREIAEQIVELRDQLGSFQSYEDLEELNIPADQFEKLQWNTTIQGIASDCTC